MPIRRLVSGTFFCAKCEEEFLLTRVVEDQVACPSCGGGLEEVDIESEEEEEEEEN